MAAAALLAAHLAGSKISRVLQEQASHKDLAAMPKKRAVQ
jgi:hypothetical protein